MANLAEGIVEERVKLSCDGNCMGLVLGYWAIKDIKIIFLSAM